MRKVYDCFTFFNELDLLEIRLRYGYPYVDYFVISEANLTHQSNPKPYNFLENQDRFAPYLDKVIYIPVDFEPTDGTWKLEKAQRQALMYGLQEANDNDLIIVSDLDEFVNYPIITDLNIPLAKLDQSLFFYFLNTTEKNVYWTRAGVATYNKIKELKGTQPLRDLIIEDDDINDIPSIISGWHFSYMGGLEQIKTKLKNFAHNELNTEDVVNDQYILDRINNGDDIAQRGGKYTEVDLYDIFPLDLYNIVLQYPHLLK